MCGAGGVFFCCSGTSSLPQCIVYTVVVNLSGTGGMKVIVAAALSLSVLGQELDLQQLQSPSFFALTREVVPYHTLLGFRVQDL